MQFLVILKTPAEREVKIKTKLWLLKGDRIVVAMFLIFPF